MKLLLSSLFVLAVLLIGTSYAYADSLEFEVTANHEVVDIMGYGPPESQVYLTIWDSKGDVMVDNMYRPTDKDEGLFRYMLTLRDFNGYGDYIGQISHENSKYVFEFSFKEKTDPTFTQSQFSSSDVTQQDQDIERLQSEIRKQQNRIGELEDENRVLKDKVSQLQDDINRMAQEFLQTIINQMDWFRTQITN